MEFNLDDLITKIKECALLNGFISVDTYKFNMNSNPDTLLPKLFIKVSNINYDKFLNACVEKEYNLDLVIIVAAATAKPAITIENLADGLMRALFGDIAFFSNINYKQKIQFNSFELTDDQEEYSRYGGAFGRLSIRILNTEKI